MKNTQQFKFLPIPPHFNPNSVGRIWKVPYQQRAQEATKWARKHKLSPAIDDKFKIALLIIDAQNAFCIPEFELFVAGQSGTGAIDDNRRLSKFIYHNLANITKIYTTLDTHQVMQIFHPIFLVNNAGEHPQPYTTITYEDIVKGHWKFNKTIASNLNISPKYGQELLLYYSKVLEVRGKYALTIWPYHALQGSIGHALVSSIEEAIFFHTIARESQPQFEEKGNIPFTEHYSALSPEILDGPDGKPIARKNEYFMQLLDTFDIVIIAGQAKSHCVAWTIDDLLSNFLLVDKELVKKVYLLEDCTSPVVIPNVIDYTEIANDAFRRFEKAGMHIVKSSVPIDNWLDDR